MQEINFSQKQSQTLKSEVFVTSTMVLEKLKEENASIALIGASNDRSKYGNKIYRDLRNKGYNVTPINPKEDTIEGDKAYTSIEMMEKLPDIANFVVLHNNKLGLLFMYSTYFTCSPFDSIYKRHP